MGESINSNLKKSFALFSRAVIPSLGMYSRETPADLETWGRMFTAVLLKIYRARNNPNVHHQRNAVYPVYILDTI